MKGLFKYFKGKYVSEFKCRIYELFSDFVIVIFSFKYFSWKKNEEFLSIILSSNNKILLKLSYNVDGLFILKFWVL